MQSWPCHICGTPAACYNGEWRCSAHGGEDYVPLESLPRFTDGEMAMLSRMFPYEPNMPLPAVAFHEGSNRATRRGKNERNGGTNHTPPKKKRRRSR